MASVYPWANRQFEGLNTVTPAQEARGAWSGLISLAVIAPTCTVSWDTGPKHADFRTRHISYSMVSAAAILGQIALCMSRPETHRYCNAGRFRLTNFTRQHPSHFLFVLWCSILRSLLVKKYIYTHAFCFARNNILICAP